MFLHEAELFKEMSREVIKEIDSVMIEESYEGGTSLFREGDPASNFYILGEGKVRLTIGEEGYMTHAVSNPGEVFGWSSLLQDGFYTASAERSVPTKVLRIEREKLNKIFESHPLIGMSFFRRLAGVVGKRLTISYRSLLAAHREVGPSTYGISEEPDPE